MPAFGTDPSFSSALIHRNTGLGNLRSWEAGVLGSTELSQSGSPGQSFSLVYQTYTEGVTPPPQATSIEIRCYLPGTTTQVGSTWAISDPDTNGQTRTFHYDNDPLSESAGSPRAGMVELHIRAIKDTVPTFDYDSRGSGLTGGSDGWRRGMLRALPTLVSHTLSNASLGGAEPSLFAYPDPIFVQATFDAQFFSTDGHTVHTEQSGTSIAAEGTTSAGPTLSWTHNDGFDLVDDEYNAGKVDLLLELDSDSMSGSSGNYTEYKLANTGHEAGWTRVSDRILKYVDRFDVDPTVTLANQVFDLPTSNVYNRGEVVTGSFEVHNARNEAITPVAADRVRVKRAIGGAYEDTAAVNRSSGVVSWTVTFGASGNVAPADTVGDAKVLEWNDTSGSITLANPSTAQFGLLSSLVDVVDVVTAHEGTNTTVYNRGETATVTGRLLNRRGQGFANFTGESFRSVNTGTGALEDTATIGSHVGSTGQFSLSLPFGTSGNVAAATQAGSPKSLRWLDSSGNTASDDALGALSSLLNLDIHLQLNNNTLDPNLDTIQRLTSDLGFYSVRITNQRGQGKNGVSVTDHLQDDQLLVASVDRTATTTTVNGLAGWLPLAAWSAALPGGGWDHWIDNGTYQGNSYGKTRQGANAADYTLLAIDPNILVVCGGGHNTSGEDSLHWHAGSDLLVGATLLHNALSETVPVDDDTTLDPGGQPYPRAYMAIARFNVATGAAEYFDSDNTWKSSEANPGGLYKWQLISIRRANELAGNGSVGDANSYVVTIPGEDTADWGASDLFFVPIMYYNSTPYSVFGLTGALGKANQHGGYAVDPVALGLHGILGTR